MYNFLRYFRFRTVIHHFFLKNAIFSLHFIVTLEVIDSLELRTKDITQVHDNCYVLWFGRSLHAHLKKVWRYSLYVELYITVASVIAKALWLSREVTFVINSARPDGVSASSPSESDLRNAFSFLLYCIPVFLRENKIAIMAPSLGPKCHVRKLRRCLFIYLNIFYWIINNKKLDIN